MQAGISIRAIAYEKSGRWFTTEEPFLRAKERTDAGSSAFRHPRSELIAPLPQEVEPAFNNRKLHMRLPWGFAAAGLTEKMDRLVTIDEVELGKGHDAVAVERGLKGEVKPAQGLDVDQPAHLQGGPDASSLPQGQFLTEQGVDGLQGRDLAT